MGEEENLVIFSCWASKGVAGPSCVLCPVPFRAVLGYYEKGS